MYLSFEKRIVVSIEFKTILQNSIVTSKRQLPTLYMELLNHREIETETFYKTIKDIFIYQQKLHTFSFFTFFESLQT